MKGKNHYMIGFSFGVFSGLALSIAMKGLYISLPLILGFVFGSLNHKMMSK